MISNREFYIMSKSRIGSNLVFVDLPDEEEFYTLDNYRLLLEQYSAYLDYIGYLEFSHVVNVTPKEAEMLGNHARSLGFETWSIHSEHLNVNDTLAGYLEIQKHEDIMRDTRGLSFFMSKNKKWFAS